MSAVARRGASALSAQLARGFSGLDTGETASHAVKAPAVRQAGVGLPALCAVLDAGRHHDQPYGQAEQAVVVVPGRPA